MNFFNVYSFFENFIQYFDIVFPLLHLLPHTLLHPYPSYYMFFLLKLTNNNNKEKTTAAKTMGSNLCWLITAHGATLECG